MSGPPKLHDEAELDAAHAVEHHTVAATTAGPDDLEPQLKYERLGADVKDILKDASATALCLSEKVLALGTSLGNIHILDYSGNEVGCGDAVGGSNDLPIPENTSCFYTYSAAA
eukprot:GHRQ01035505.1.p2 GENE.GHRQ01035505.1~~GHRQ01035505.1.p2  ORF type:complete len:114 (+),score=23.24 GHRQ01035505.1:288-629(+)